MKNIKPLILASAFLATAALLSSCSVPQAKNPQVPSTAETHKAIPTTSTTPSAYNDLDAAAILGALSLARQTPSDPVQLKAFIKKLDEAIKTPKKSKLDEAVTGNVLAQYVISDKGSAAPICFAVKPPVVKGAKPGQSQWVLYFEPKGTNSSKSDFVLIQIGLLNCVQAQAYAENLSAEQRTSVANASQSVAKEAALKVPSSVLTPTGLLLLDEARGILPAPSPKASK